MSQRMKHFLKWCLLLALLSLAINAFAQNRRSNSYRQQNGYRQGNTYNPRRGTTTGESILSRLQMQAQKEQGDVKQQSIKERKKKNKNASSDSQNLEKEDVVLVVTGEGVSKEEATKIALRSAIEQAYGTFVSANTSIVNDELVKDEIATIASGNIKSYKELASAILPDGSSSVTLSAVVSTGKLISYAQAHGGSVEFAGQAFAMEMKMRKLNKENETKILENLCVELKEVASTLYHFSVEIGKPQVYSSEDNSPETYILPVCLIAKPNSNYYTWIEYMKNVFQAISLSNHEKNELKENGIESYEFSFLGTMFLFRNKYNAIDSSLKQCSDLLNSWKYNWEINIDNGRMVLRPKDNKPLEIDRSLEFIYQLNVINPGGEINGERITESFKSISVLCRPSFEGPEYDLQKYQEKRRWAKETGFCYIGEVKAKVKNKNSDYYRKNCGRYPLPMGIEYEAFIDILDSDREWEALRLDLYSFKGFKELHREIGRHSVAIGLPNLNAQDLSWYITLNIPLSESEIEKIHNIKANWKSE